MTASGIVVVSQPNSRRSARQEKIITIYCLCADFLSAWGLEDDPQARVSTAEVMTVALVAAALFHGHQDRARLLLKGHGYIPRMLSASRFNRRLHAIEESVWEAFFALLAEAHKQINDGQEYVVDSMPIPVCDNYRIGRCRIYQGPEHRGYIARKRRYFFGLRVHLVITATGKPVEFVLRPGAEAAIRAFKRLRLDLPAGAGLYSDTAYTDYTEEALLSEEGDLRLVCPRKKNSLWRHPGWLEYICKYTRKRVETTFSRIEAERARHIHAVTPRGFELKVFLTLLAYSI